MRSLLILLMSYVVFIFNSNICKSQDYIPSTVDNFYCPVLETAGGCWVRFPYFPSNNVTLKALVVFCNYPDENYEPPGTVYCQYWPGSNHLEKPRWADTKEFTSFHSTQGIEIFRAVCIITNLKYTIIIGRCLPQ